MCRGFLDNVHFIDNLSTGRRGKGAEYVWRVADKSQRTTLLKTYEYGAKVKR